MSPIHLLVMSQWEHGQQLSNFTAEHANEACEYLYSGYVVENPTRMTSFLFQTLATHQYSKNIVLIAISQNTLMHILDNIVSFN